MIMSPLQILITILAMAAGTMLTRFLPFLLFPAGRRTPPFVVMLGKVLPCAVIGLLVVYCLRNVNILSGSRGLPEFLAMAVILVLHLWKKNTLLSIGCGTAAYMVLVQLVFA